MSQSGERIDWVGRIDALEARVPSPWMHPAVEDFLSRYKGKNLLVACSGGADSVCMLLLLYIAAKKRQIYLVVAHYNHRWRGEDSQRDAAFVADLAKDLGLVIDMGTRPPKEAAFTETTARALRLAFLREAAKRHRCEAIALGHQLDDILETQLIRVSRGAGADGLAAPRPISRFENWPTHIRPLLETRAASIREDLQAVSIPWCEDSSNSDTTIVRNALRHQVIPELETLFARDISLGAARSRKLLEEDAEALDMLTRSFFPRAFSMAERLDRKRLRDKPRAITRRALLSWLGHHQLLSSVSAHAMDLIIEAIYEAKPNNRFSLGQHYLVLDSDKMEIEWAEAEESGIELTRIAPGDSAILSTGAQLSSAPVEIDAVTYERIASGQVDPQTEAYLVLKSWEWLEIRGWEPGDRFAPIGAPGRKKLKDWFIDRHIPRKERKQLPLVVDETGEILWVPGFPPADIYKITPETKLALRLTYLSRNPL